MKLIRSVLTFILPALLFGAGGCFTGVESTPRIKESDVRHQQADGITPEQRFLTGISPLPPRQWTPERKWLVANDRISLIFSHKSDNTDNLAGHTVRFEGIAPATSLTGEDAGEILLRTDDGRRLYYHVPGLTSSKIDTLSSLEIPFTVDLDIVARIDSAVTGRKLFIRTPSWYSPANRELVQGLRHIEVQIDSVTPGNENFAAAVYFSISDPKILEHLKGNRHEYMVFMSVGNSRAATRNFDTLFSFTDPRTAYPEIKDDVWELIIRSRINKNMTRDEVRLALGSPASVERIPTYGGMIERWSYSDGVFAVFEDGFVTRFRQ